MKKVIFLFPYPIGTAASQRFRFEQYLKLLSEHNFELELQSFLDKQTWEILYKKGNYILKTIGIVRGFLRRLGLLFKIHKYDFVFIQREASPIGPPFFEFIIAKILKKKIIFDFDDAIWLPNTSDQNKIIAFLKFHSKTGLICKWSYKISAGNKFLSKYALKNNPNVFINPTTIDTNHLHNKIKYQNSDEVIIGWTGTQSTLIYLEEIIQVIRKLEEHFNFTFLVICDKNPDYDLKSFSFLPWNKTSEIDDLLKINIGIMPLKDDEWAKGKCGFKALQYMSLGIPAVVSPVGVNLDIIINNENGFICINPEDWYLAFEKLLSNATLREEMGKKARKKIIENYSIQANSVNFLTLFD